MAEQSEVMIADFFLISNLILFFILLKKLLKDLAWNIDMQLYF